MLLNKNDPRCLEYIFQGLNPEYFLQFYSVFKKLANLVFISDVDLDLFLIPDLKI